MNSRNKDLFPEKGGSDGDSSISKTESESEKFVRQTKLEGADEEMNDSDDILTDSDLEHLNQVSRVSSQEKEKVETSFMNLLRFNRAFRLYISSYLITCAGE
jgi:CRISPR/Cas system CMR subunit Cmr6 (Cas7 group RAMP superfamily)